MASLNMLLSWQNVVTAIFVYLASLTIYRLFLHPLARFPGPKLAAITRWYEGYYDVVQNGQYTFKIKELHKQYGPIIRISPYELHVSDSTFFNTLYRQEGRWDRYAFAWDAWGAEGPTIHTVDHERHRARRQPLATFFAKAKVADRKDMIRGHVNNFCDRLSKIAESGKTVNLGAAATALARDVAFDFILAKSYNSLDRDDFDVAVLHAAQGAGPLWRITKHVGYVLPLLNSMPLDWAIKISDDEMKTFFAHLKNAMADTKRLMAAAVSPSPEDRGQRTIVHEILDSKLPPHDKSFQRVFEDVSSVSGAGFETIGGALRLIFFHVFSDPEILQRLRAELDSAKEKHPDVMELKVLEQLPYLTSTIMEGLRLSPGIATRMARIAPDRDLFYKDWRIPAGTPVGMTTILMHTDENLYPDPQSFKPERWVDGNGGKNAEKAYAPFSKGTRMCIGMHDQFVIGTKGKGFLEAHVSIRED
ncbi:cytochrome P450 [Cryphonectria parasitica EP155]|uniref:Cytochrome P450 n=1 Tax=Cryphonectria parasitica (strain ATCC 38755 / EP155) TaxID=660469 RepID=A0A9P4XXU0_CRYP1|nr:cytochrome P450 [Cryphonectria parasitica EP155]KAF3763269.1 cytochrome P450 [Cryphonectria parasitica EP155]